MSTPAAGRDPSPGRTGRGRALAIGLAVLVLLLAAAAEVDVRSWRPHAGPAPAPPERRRVTTPTPPARLPSSSPPAERVERTEVTLPWEPAPTPTEVAGEAEPASPPRRAAATPTPPVERCVSADWRSSVSPAAPGQVLIDVEVHNACGRDLGAMEVWFVVSGRRGGELVRTVAGHLFDPLYRDSDGRATIALPGSIDWYDEIDVRVEPAGGGG